MPFVLMRVWERPANVGNPPFAEVDRSLKWPVRRFSCPTWDCREDSLTRAETVFTHAPIRHTSAMPKTKTHKGTKKRFRLTANGKAQHRQSGTSHLAARMSQKRKRNLRGTKPVSKVMEKSIQEALAGNSY